jgi:hypothetical protein
MFSHLQLEDFKTTDIDYLLNKGRLKEGTEILTAISAKLDEAYHQEQSSLAESIDNSLLHIARAPEGWLRPMSEYKN